jgi:hypothetical protein
MQSLQGVLNERLANSQEGQDMLGHLTPEEAAKVNSDPAVVEELNKNLDSIKQDIEQRKIARTEEVQSEYPEQGNQQQEPDLDTPVPNEPSHAIDENDGFESNYEDNQKIEEKGRTNN